MCDRCTGEKESPTELEKTRFDYAWKWFDFHAEQRTKMFNYMLIGMGIFAAASVTAVDKKLDLETAVLASAAFVVALVFCLIDHRNRLLYTVAMDVLIDMERSVVFADKANNQFLDHDNRTKQYGVSSRVAWEDKSSDRQAQLSADPLAPPTATTYLDSLKRHGVGALRGQHRYWMPFVALSFATLFLAAATRGWLIVFKGIPRDWLLIEGAVIALVGLLYGLWQWRNLKQSSVWPILSVGLGLAVIAAALTCPILRKPIAPSGAIEVAVGADLNSIIDLRIKEPLSNGQDAVLGALLSANFGPFGSGSDALDCNASDHVRAAAEVRDALAEAQRGNRRVAVVLVGSTDRTALLPALRRQYGSDAGLARARISAVERCLWSQDMPVPTDVLRVVGGPAYTPATPRPASSAQRAMRDDRFVHVLLVGLQARR